MRASSLAALVTTIALAASLPATAIAAADGRDPLSNDTVPFAEPDFGTAKLSFDKKSPGDRALLQVVMIALGCWKSGPMQAFDQALFSAVRDCQQRHGLKASGNPDDDTTRVFINQSKSQFREWGFRVAYLTPAKTDFVWVPFGIDGALVPQSDGLTYIGRNEDVLEHLFRYANTTARSGYKNFLAAYDSERKADKTELTAKAALQKADGFVIRVSRVRADGKKEEVYLRGQQLGFELVGFVFSWNPDDADVAGERAALLISDALAASHYRLVIRPPSVADLTGDAE